METSYFIMKRRRILAGASIWKTVLGVTMLALTGGSASSPPRELARQNDPVHWLVSEISL